MTSTKDSDTPGLGSSGSKQSARHTKALKYMFAGRLEGRKKIIRRRRKDREGVLK